MMRGPERLPVFKAQKVAFVLHNIYHGLCDSYDVSQKCGFADTPSPRNCLTPLRPPSKKNQKLAEFPIWTAPIFKILKLKAYICSSSIYIYFVLYILPNLTQLHHQASWDFHIPSEATYSCGQVTNDRWQERGETWQMTSDRCQFVIFSCWFCGIGVTIRKRQEIQCLRYAGFLFLADWQCFESWLKVCRSVTDGTAFLILFLFPPVPRVLNLTESNWVSSLVLQGVQLWLSKVIFG